MLSEINEIVLYQMILLTIVTVSFFHKDLLFPIKYIKSSKKVVYQPSTS